MNIPQNTKLHKHIVMHASFWFMKDNQLFCKPKGMNIEEIKTDMLRIAKENPYGMVCPVIILRGNKEVRRVGTSAHVDGKGNVDLSKWYEEIMKDDVVRSYNGV